MVERATKDIQETQNTGDVKAIVELQSARRWYWKQVRHCQIPPHLRIKVKVDCGCEAAGS